MAIMVGMGGTTAAPVAVSARAAAKATALSRREGYDAAILRLRVTAGGCSGFSYKLSFEREAAPDDHVVEAHGLTVLVDPASEPIVRGATIDFVDAMLGGGFKVHNPQAMHECACGDSFSL